KRITENLTRQEYLVLNADDPRLLLWAKELSAKTQIIMFGSKPVDGDCVYLSDNAIRYKFNGSSGVILEEVGRMKIGGKHNRINACAAGAIALSAGADPTLIGRGLCTFTGLPHRLEFVASVNGIEFYNDSKSTTAESIQCAVNAFDSKIHLIAGGRDKGSDFSIVKESMRDKIKSLILIGEAKDRMAAIWEGLAPVCKSATLEDAVSIAFGIASAGEKIIFSPGCSSFDMFKNFEHRGEMFKEIVGTLEMYGKAS
ncbi:MAG: hypothetical protein LBU70_07280, partial [Chitinispirillales bacterium]|nr:hypothetical protein [Chitinispirillales bacterium]